MTPDEHTDTFVAHTPNSLGSWHYLPDHLLSVAALAAGFAEDFDAGAWAYAAGLWHDLGKFSPEFQAYLRNAVREQPQETRGGRGPDHSTAGAQHAVEAIPVLGHLLAYGIAGHHGGLPDGLAKGACLEDRLEKVLPDWRHGLDHLPEVPPLEPTSPLREALEKGSYDPISVAFLTRMLFSCLVDADFLDTERHMAPEKADERPTWPEETLERMEEALDRFCVELERNAKLTTVNRERARVREACLRAAEQPPGLFSLTVPTGGGKTLSSLAFALRHGVRNGLRRVVYVIPFTSIIEQNADTFRNVMAPLVGEGLPDPVLEHHSNLRIDEEDRGEEQEFTDPRRLATENWDAPLVVTTSVQFYESLFGNRTSRCRKLHNLARSVVILDEVQTLPVDLLAPCLSALRELAANYGTTIVLCTATQPAVERREGFEIGLEAPHPIIERPARLYETLRRVKLQDEGTLSDEKLSGLLLDEPAVLCIVNTRRHAAALFDILCDDPAHFHLSAAMVPEHRSTVLEEIRERLKKGEPCRVISTQLIEAGVDIDFPVVYRSLAGMDSIAQAAGRCNRSGTLKGLGRTHLFRAAEHRVPGFVLRPANVTEQLLDLHEDPMSLTAIEHFFRLLYWDCDEDQWDARGILQRFRLDGRNPDLPFLFDFKTAGEDFRLIEDAGRPVIVPWENEGKVLCDQLRGSQLPVRTRLLRRLQRYTVQIPFRSWEKEVGAGTVEMLHEEYPVLVNAETHYDEYRGLNLEHTEMTFLSI